MAHDDGVSLWAVLPVARVRRAMQWTADFSGTPSGFFALDGERSGLGEPPPWLCADGALCSALCGRAMAPDCACARDLRGAALDAAVRGEAVEVPGVFGAGSVWACPLVLELPSGPSFRGALAATLPQAAALPSPQQLAEALAVPAEACTRVRGRLEAAALSSRQAAALRTAIGRLQEELAASMMAAAEAALVRASTSAARGSLVPAALSPQVDMTHALGAALAGWRSPEDLLTRAVAFLSAHDDVAHAQAWLPGPPDRCDRCPHQPVCRHPQTCLHAVAATTDTAPDLWSRIPPGSLPEAFRMPGCATEPLVRATASRGPLGAWVLALGARAGVALKLGTGPDPAGLVAVAGPRCGRHPLVRDGRALATTLSVALCGEQVSRATAGRRPLPDLELAAENERLQQAVQAQKLLLASMSHELRTPLNAIIGYSELLQDDAEGSLNEAQARHMRTIEASGRQLLQLTNDLLTIATAGAGSLPLRPGPCIVAQVLGETAQALMPLARSRGTEIKTDLPADDVFVVTDPDRLRQIVINLLSNAIKFAPQGSTVELSGRVTATELVVAVRDKGPGIAPDEQDAIFEVFHKGTASLGAHAEGLGLGLPLVRHLAELQGGAVTVRSNPGEGSEFTVSLPAGLAPEDAPREPAAPAPAADPTAPRPLAVVFERDAPARELMVAAAAEAGLTALALGSPGELCSTVAQAAPDVVLFGQIRGGSVADPELLALRSDPATASVPVIFAGNGSLLEQALQVGVAETVSYPLDRSALRAVIHRTVSPVSGGRPRVALVVDDNPAFYEALWRILATRGVRCLYARDGHEGVGLARRSRPDVVILDLMMPRLNGWQVLKVLEEDEATRHIPVVVLTVKPLSADERERLAGHCRAVMSKAEFARGELWAVLDSLDAQQPV